MVEIVPIMISNFHIYISYINEGVCMCVYGKDIKAALKIQRKHKILHLIIVEDQLFDWDRPDFWMDSTTIGRLKTFIDWYHHLAARLIFDLNNTCNRKFCNTFATKVASHPLSICLSDKVDPSRTRQQYSRTMVQCKWSLAVLIYYSTHNHTNRYSSSIVSGPSCNGWAMCGSS